MQFENYEDAYTFSVEQSHEHKMRMLAAYCVHHTFPMETVAFLDRARNTFSFTSDTCGLYRHVLFQVQGWWNRSSSTRRVRNDYPPPPPMRIIEDLLEDRAIEVYIQLLASFLRQNEFVTISESPLLRGLQPIYQVGGTCFLAAVLNFVLHVPELRKATFEAFRLKSAKVSSFTLASFEALGSFASEPLGSTLLALGDHIRERSYKHEDPVLRLGASRSLMRAFMLRVPGFEDLEEHVIVDRGRALYAKNKLPSGREELPMAVTRILTNEFERDPSKRGGILSGSNEQNNRHAAAFVRDVNGQIFVFNWGVGGTWHQLNEFLKLYPFSIAIVMYSLPNINRRLGFENIPVKKKKKFSLKSFLRR